MSVAQSLPLLSFERPFIPPLRIYSLMPRLRTMEKSLLESADPLLLRQDNIGFSIFFLKPVTR